MDAHAHGHFIFAQRKVGMSYLRDDAGRQRKAHSAGVVLGLLGSGKHFIQGAALGRLSPGTFIHEENAGHTAAGIGIGIGIHIVGAYNGAGFNVVHLTHLSGHIKVHDITGVVAVEIQNTGPGFHFLGDIVDLLCRRGLKHAADAAAIEQALAHITQEQRQMARATAGDNGHLAVLLLGSAVAAQVAVHIFYLIAVGIIDTFEHLVHIVFRRVDNFFHKNVPP